jgi:hypothetical protein
MSVLNDSVLVLNKHLLAVQVTTVRDAIIALVAGRAKVIDQEYQQFSWDQWAIRTPKILATNIDSYTGIVHSPSVNIVAPQVIVAIECEYLETTIRSVRYSRRNVFQRDGMICQYCGKKCSKDESTIDHVYPRSRGGKNSWANVVTCCISCNAEKGDKTLEELGWTLRSKPTVPRWKSHIGRPFSTEKKKYWERFLS